MRRWCFFLWLLCAPPLLAQFGSRVILENTLGNRINEIITADWNHDAAPDVMVARANGTIDCFLNQGNGSFSAKQTLVAGLHALRTIAAADLNGDGRDDIVSASLSLSPDTDFLYVFINNPDRTITTVPIDTQNAIANKIINAKTADVDNDGDVDIVAISDVELQVYYNDGQAHFTRSVVAPGLNLEYYDLQLGDVNNDGFVDVIVGATQVVIYSNDSGTFVYDSARTGAVVNNGLVFLVRLADFDNDGDADLLISGNDQTDLRWYKNDGDGFFSSPQVFQANVMECRSAVAEDFDGDGDMDVFTIFPQTGEVVWYENDGTGHLDTAHTVFTGVVPHTRTVHSDDLNADGRPDLIWAQELSVHLSTVAVSLRPPAMEAAFRIYRAAGRGTLYLRSDRKATVTVSDGFGRIIVSNRKVYPGLHPLPINVPTGVYFLTVQTGKEKLVRKFVLD